MSTPLPAKIAESLSRPLNVRQYVILFAIGFCFYMRAISVVLMVAMPNLSRGQSFIPQYSVGVGIAFYAAISLLSLVTIWLMEQFGPPVLRYAMRRL